MNPNEALPVVGSRVGPYEVVGPARAGGMGEVYEVRHGYTGRRLALKRFRPRQALGPAERGSARAAFLLEVRRLVRLEDEVPGGLRVHDAGEASDGSAYFVADWVDAPELRGQRLGPREAAEVVAAVARQLGEVYARTGILHRDIKPGNLLGRGGAVRVVDWGVATAATDAPAAAFAPSFGTADAGAFSRFTGLDAGTPGYMAPERLLRPERVGVAAEVFALGATLHELLTGVLPFDRLDLIEGRFDPTRLERAGCPAELADVTFACLRFDPAARYSGFDALRAELEAYLARRPVAAPPLPYRCAQDSLRRAVEHLSLAQKIDAAAVVRDRGAGLADLLSPPELVHAPRAYPALLAALQDAGACACAARGLPHTDAGRRDLWAACRRVSESSGCNEWLAAKTFAELFDAAGHDVRHGALMFVDYVGPEPPAGLADWPHAEEALRRIAEEVGGPGNAALAVRVFGDRVAARLAHEAGADAAAVIAVLSDAAARAVCARGASRPGDAAAFLAFARRAGVGEDAACRAGAAVARAAGLTLRTADWLERLRNPPPEPVALPVAPAPVALFSRPRSVAPGVGRVLKMFAVTAAVVVGLGVGLFVLGALREAGLSLGMIWFGALVLRWLADGE